MMTERVLACEGALAKTPYYYDKIYMNLYSVEELCYVIFENAYMIDKDIMNTNLVDWIGQECQLQDLARDLYTMLNQNVAVSTFAGTILEYVGYYSQTDIEKCESILKMNVSMNVFEKWKAKGDFLYENRHFSLALKEYEHVLKKIGDEEIDLKSQIMNNMGVTYMALRLYESAEECFLEAYKLNQNKEAYEHYLISKRMRMPEDEYIRTVTSEQDSYIVGVPIESKLQEAFVKFEESDEALSYKELFESKNGVNATEYYSKMTNITEKLKADYRDEVLESNAL